MSMLEQRHLRQFKIPRISDGQSGLKSAENQLFSEFERNNRKSFGELIGFAMAPSKPAWSHDVSGLEVLGGPKVPAFLRDSMQFDAFNRLTGGAVTLPSSSGAFPQGLFGEERGIKYKSVDPGNMTDTDPHDQKIVESVPMADKYGLYPPSAAVKLVWEKFINPELTVFTNLFEQDKHHIGSIMSFTNLPHLNHMLFQRRHRPCAGLTISSKREKHKIFRETKEGYMTSYGCITYLDDFKKRGMGSIGSVRWMATLLRKGTHTIRNIWRVCRKQPQVGDVLGYVKQIMVEEHEDTLRQYQTEFLTHKSMDDPYDRLLMEWENARRVSSGDVSKNFDPSGQNPNKYKGLLKVYPSWDHSLIHPDTWEKWNDSLYWEWVPENFGPNGMPNPALYNSLNHWYGKYVTVGTVNYSAEHYASYPPRDFDFPDVEVWRVIRPKQRITEALSVTNKIPTVQVFLDISTLE